MVRPSRRQLLSALATGSSALLAGCLLGPENAPDPTATPDSTSTPTETQQSVPEFPGDTASDACPPFDGAARVVCYDAVDPDAMPLVMVPAAQTIEPDKATEFTLRNQSSQQFQANFYHWQLYKRIDGDWYYIVPESWPEPLTPLAAGETHTWSLTVQTGAVSDGAAIGSVQGTDTLTVDGLGGGYYAFATDGWFAAGSYEEPVAVATSFELQADSLELTPTSAVAETNWDGETLIARTTRGELDDDEPRDAYILERIEDTADPAEELIVEQVVRDDQLRDAIALSREYDADRVRLEEYSSSVPAFRLDESRIYAFQGAKYRVTTVAGESD